jgi:hypothetical protein
MNPTVLPALPQSIDAKVAAWIRARARATRLPVGAAVGVNPDTGRIEMLFDMDLWERLDDREREIVLKHELVHVLHGHIYLPRHKDNLVEWARTAAQHCLIDWSLGCPDMRKLDRKIYEHYADVAETAPPMPWAPDETLVRWRAVAEWLGLDPNVAPPSAQELTRLILEQLKRVASDGTGKQGDGAAPQARAEDSCCRPGGAATPQSELDRAELAKAARESQDAELAEAAKGAAPTGSTRVRRQPVLWAKRDPTIARLLARIARIGLGQRRIMTSWMREGRYPLLPGRARLRSIRPVVCVDTSGSVPDSLVAEFSAVIAGTMPRAVFAEFTTTVVPHGERWRGRQTTGGTLFGPALEWAAAQRPDVVVIMTDGMPSDAGVPTSRAPIIWVLPEGERLYGWSLRPRDHIVYIPTQQG